MSSPRPSQHELRLDLPAERSSVPAVRHTVDVLLHDLGVGSDRERIALAVSEACSNVVLHAYRGDGSPEHPPVIGPLSVTVRLSATWVRALVEDEGNGVRPREDSPGAGFGLSLISALTDELEVGRADGRTVIEMGFARVASGAAGGGAARTVVEAA